MPDQEKNEKLQEQPLTPKQLRCIAFLITCPTHEEVKKCLKISDQTLYRWLKSPIFKKELKRKQDEILQQAFDVFKANMIRAANVLVELLDVEGNELRRRAANDLISYCLKIRELEEFEMRLEQVERVVLERKTYR